MKHSGFRESWHTHIDARATSSRKTLNARQFYHYLQDHNQYFDKKNE